MRKLFTILTAAAVLTAAPGLTGRLCAAENMTRKGAVSAEQAGVSKAPAADGKKKGIGTEERKDGSAEVNAKAAEGKAEQTKKAEEEKRAAEEAKKVVVARVNGADINMFMLVRAMNKVAARYVKPNEPLKPEMNLNVRKEALDELIFEELAVQEAIRQGINSTPGEIDNVVNEVKRNLGSEEDYKAYLDQFSLTEEELKKRIERSQRFETITAREIFGKSEVDEKRLREAYEKEKERYILPENYYVEDVLFVTGKDEKSTLKRAEEALETIKKNANDVWRLTLDGTFNIRKMKVTKERNPETYKAMSEMKVGDLSGVIRDKDTFHIIKVLKKDPPRESTFEEARPTLETKFLIPAKEQRRKEWEKELRENAKIEILLDEIKK